jgi:hypothetical protein
LAVQVTAL